MGFGAFLISVIVLILAWLFFYRVIKAKTPTSRKVKTTIVVLLFASLILKFSHDIDAVFSRTTFSFNKQGEIDLAASPFRIPANQDNRYCNRFTDQNGKPITVVSVRDDGRYCGEFWRFKTKELILLPYKNVDANHTIYWASPNLQIISPNK